MTPATFVSYPLTKIFLSGYTEIDSHIAETCEEHIPIRSDATCIRIDIRRKEFGNMPIHLHLVPHYNPAGSLTILSPNRVLEVPVTMIPSSHIHVYREIFDSDGYVTVCLIPLSYRHDNLDIAEIHRSLWEKVQEQDTDDDSIVYRYYYAELMLHFHVIIYDTALLPDEKPHHFPSVDSLLKAYPA